MQCLVRYTVGKDGMLTTPACPHGDFLGPIWTLAESTRSQLMFMEILGGKYIDMYMQPNLYLTQLAMDLV